MQPQQQWRAPRWQYKILHKIRNPEVELNALGAEGWELVEIDNDPKARNFDSTRYVLKRPY